MIAGDGIRSDLQAIAAHLNGGSFAAARLSAPRGGSLSDSDQFDWLEETANRFVTLLRPRLSQAAATAKADDRQ